MIEKLNEKRKGEWKNIKDEEEIKERKARNAGEVVENTGEGSKGKEDTRKKDRNIRRTARERKT